jgi:hypothetical protein
MANDTYTVRHADQRAINSADQAEMRAIIAGSAVPDAGVYDEVLSGEMEDLEVGGPEMERWNRQDVAMDGEVGAVRDDLQRRAEMLGDAYPFEITGGSLIHRGTGTGFYEYCLGICSAPSITRSPFVKLPRSFERIVAVLIRHHLGQAWQMFHTGAPRDPMNGTNFFQSMQKLSTASSDGREWCWNPVDSFPQKPSVSGDGGLDFVVWRPAPDKRIGQLYVVGQCACGNDWGEKFNDISLGLLDKWFRPLSHVPITRCFTTPFWLSPGNFEVAHADAGWTLDRGRLTLLAEDAAGDADFAVWQSQLSGLFDLVAQAA